MKTLNPEITMLDVASIKPFIKRSRLKEGFDEVKSTIADVGLKMPIQVRDITDRKPDSRRRPDGGTYRYELICGQGRLEAHVQLGKEKIPAIIVSAPEIEIVGRFLAENLIRKPMTWVEKARLVKRDIDSGTPIEKVARKFHITPKSASRYQRILENVARDVETEMGRLNLAEAEALTTLPPGEQSIVMEVMRETGEKQVRSLINKVEEVKEETGGKLSKDALKKSLQRVEDDLKAQRDRLKLMRTHDAIGPVNLETLLRDKAFRKAMLAEGINFKRFEELTK